jgi:hypothetical protein
VRVSCQVDSSILPGEPGYSALAVPLSSYADSGSCDWPGCQVHRHGNSTFERNSSAEHFAVLQPVTVSGWRGVVCRAEWDLNENHTPFHASGVQARSLSAQMKAGCLNLKALRRRSLFMRNWIFPFEIRCSIRKPKARFRTLCWDLEKAIRDHGLQARNEDVNRAASSPVQAGVQMPTSGRTGYGILAPRKGWF